jgi:uncharacterized delta-60 repeat protein
MKKITTFLFIIILNNYLVAQTLDNTFGTGGQTILNTNVNQKSSELLRDVVLQSDGKTIYVSDSQISRFNNFDVLDTNFGSCGIVNLSGGRKIALLNDNSFIILGTRSSISGLQPVYKYNSNGVIDSTFGNQGIININIPGIDIWDIKITLDNKIILGGTLDNNGNIDFLLIRLNSNGTFDNTFDFDGICTYDLGTTTDRGMILKVQQDNKVLLVGTSKNPNASLSNRVFAGIRINNNGSLDISFGTGGILRTILVNQSLVPSDLILENDGSFIIIGTSGKIVMAKYSNIGVLINSFGNDNNGIWLSSFNTVQNLEISSRLDKVTVNKIQTDYYISFASRNPTVKKYGIAKITPTVNNNVTNISATYQEYSLPPTTYSNTNSSYVNYLFNENNQLVFGGYASSGSGINDIIKIKYNLNLQFSSLSILNSKQVSKRFNQIIEADNQNFKCISVIAHVFVYLFDR